MSKSQTTFSTPQVVVLVCLRVVVGWHFLYEGIAKLYTPNWTSAGFLEVSRWVFADLFKWIASKVLAAGAIDPKDGFRYAFENGADSICVGMYDFQIVDDVNITLDVLKGNLQRKRPWCA
jgi:hypothetical protein